MISQVSRVSFRATDSNNTVKPAESNYTVMVDTPEITDKTPKADILEKSNNSAKSNTDNLKPETNTPEKPKSILRKIKDKLDDIADIKPGKKYTLKRAIGESIITSTIFTAVTAPIIMGAVWAFQLVFYKKIF